MSLTPITSTAHFREVASAAKTSVFSIGTDGCCGCVEMEPTVLAHAVQSPAIAFYKIHLGGAHLLELGRELRVSGVPMYIAYRGGEKLMTCTACSPASFQAFMDDVKKGAPERLAWLL